MAQVFEGELIGKGKRFGIVVSRYNEVITKSLLEGALNQLRRSGVNESDLEVAWVPGTFEIPLTLEALSKKKSFDGLVALGCIIRGETSHYEHIAQATADQISQIMIAHGVPIGFGVLTVETFEQALARAGGKIGNKGREAAQSVLEMANLIASIGGSGAEGKKEKALRDFETQWEKPVFKSNHSQKKGTGIC